MAPLDRTLLPWLAATGSAVPFGRSNPLARHA